MGSSGRIEVKSIHIWKAGLFGLVYGLFIGLILGIIIFTLIMTGSEIFSKQLSSLSESKAIKALIAGVGSIIGGSIICSLSLIILGSLYNLISKMGLSLSFIMEEFEETSLKKSLTPLNQDQGGMYKSISGGGSYKNQQNMTQAGQNQQGTSQNDYQGVRVSY